MVKFLANVNAWWQGKKTIVGGGLVMAAAVAGVARGKLDMTAGVGLLGLGLSIAGMGAKANRHQDELLSALEGVARVSVDVKSGASAQAIPDAVQTALSLAHPGSVVNVSYQNEKASNILPFAPQEKE